MKKSILIMFVAAIFLAGCAGDDGVIDPLDEDVVVDPPEVEEPVTPSEEETEPELIPLSLSVKGFDKRIECGKDISAVVEAKNAVGSVTWEITGLPSWAVSSQSGETNSVVTVSGTCPFESCDEDSSDVKIKACDADSRCKESTLKLKTKIPVVSISTKLPDIVVPYGNMVELKLKAKGGSKGYSWTTTVPGALVGADASLSAGSAISEDGVAISGEAISFVAKGIGSHTVSVYVEDEALGSHREDLEQKYGDKDKMLMRDSTSFTVLVKESGFVFKGKVVDSDGKAIKNLNSSVASTEDGDDSSEAEPVNVPYDGRLLVWVDGVAESYEVSIPSEMKIKFADSGKKVASLKKGEVVEVVAEDFDKSGSAMAFEGVSISAKNIAGESAVLSISNLVFSVDPCATIVLVSGTQFGPFEIAKEGVEIPLEVENGIGPFEWRAISYIQGVSDEEPTVETATSVFDVLPIKILGREVSPFMNGVAYASSDVPRWDLNCSDEDDDSCRRAMIKGDLNYRNVIGILAGSGVKEIAYDDLKNKPGKPMEFKEHIMVEVKDEGCQVKKVAANSIKVTVPGPEKEILGDAYVSYRYKQEGSYQAEDKTHAKLALWSKYESVIDTGKHDISKVGDEQISHYEWNRPAFPNMVDLGDRLVSDLDKLVIQLWRDADASWELEFDVKQFHIVGKNWFFFDDKDYECTMKKRKKDVKECEIPIDTTGKGSGKWYLRCNPNDYDSKSESCGESVN